jgi:hypothetical protein
MPRKNNRKVRPQPHEPSIFDPGFKAACLGCAFAGQNFKCLTSDGICLRTTPRFKRVNDAGSK